nr:hypothetical protein [Tanacetum cinerariifolium]
IQNQEKVGHEHFIISQVKNHNRTGGACHDGWEHMLLETKNEAGVHLDEEENDFMLDNVYGDNTVEELSVIVIMMEHIQTTDDKLDAEPTYDAELISEVNAS